MSPDSPHERSETMVRIAAGFIGEVGTVIICMGHHSKFGPVGLGTPATAMPGLRGGTGHRRVSTSRAPAALTARAIEYRYSGIIATTSGDARRVYVA